MCEDSQQNINSMAYSTAPLKKEVKPKISIFEESMYCVVYREEQ